MSFLKNLRSSVSRKNNVTSKTENCVKVEKKSLFLSKTSEKNSNFRDPVQEERSIKEDHSEGVIRSDTYTIIDENGRVLISESREIVSSSAISSSPKRNMFSKFGTFTRKKKEQCKNKEPEVKEQRVETYKTYKIDENPHQSSDPFNIFYHTSTVSLGKSNDQHPIEYGTYRKSKLPREIREQIEDLHLESEPVEKPYDDPDKYKTVTLKTFRKSFRDRFFTQQKDVPYNPSWFVEVDQPQVENKEDDEEERKRRQLLVFENENYRPLARSPIRNTEKSPTRRKTPVPPSRKSSLTASSSRSRSTTRSSLKKSNEPEKSHVSFNRNNNNNPEYHPTLSKPTVTVKRNETFKIERESPEPSIRIEIKNSILPNDPGKIVPVGVAKPMPTSSPRPLRTSLQDKRSGSMNRNKTNIQFTMSSNIQSSDSRHRKPETYLSTRISQTSRGESYSSKPTPLPKSSKSSKPIVENYLPLTSYELLTKMKPRSSLQPTNTNLIKSSTYKDPLRSSSDKFSDSRNSYSLQQQNNKRKNEPNVVTTSKQKTSIFIEDNTPVCKDVSNQKGLIKKRLRIKMPWR